jgi:hypothetical protein
LLLFVLMSVLRVATPSRVERLFDTRRRFEGVRIRKLGVVLIAWTRGRG